MPTSPDPTARARKTFWSLVATAVLATGGLSTALRAHPGPAAGAAVAASGAVLAISLTLAARILFALDRARRAAAPQRPPRRRSPPAGRR